jgi:hypothetical protein
MEAEKVEPLGASSEVHDPGLLRVQSQPEHVQHRGHQLAGLFGLLAGVVQDDEVIRILRQHPHRRPPPGSPVIGRASLPATPQATGPRRLSRVPRTTVRTFSAPIRPRAPQRPLLEKGRFPWPSPCADRLGSLLTHPEAGPP